MKYSLIKSLALLIMVVLLGACASGKKKPGSSGRVIIIGDKQVRVAESRKDNGLHKGWYKNPNNPHHPHTTNPGHTKGKGKKH